jgi:hypothetical protein
MVVRAIQKDSIAEPMTATPASPKPTATTRKGANVNKGRARDTSHMPIAVTAARNSGGIFRSRRCMLHGLRLRYCRNAVTDTISTDVTR